MELNRARQRALDLTFAREIEWTPLEEALGRVLGETLKAPRDLPSLHLSRMDGFAVRSRDTTGASPEAPVALTPIEERLAAGHTSSKPVSKGECACIFTGAALPPGADAVVPREEAVDQGKTLLVTRSFSPGQWVLPPGSELRKGETVLCRGTVLTATRLALVAGAGFNPVPVHRRPQVALLATGDEVREVHPLDSGPWTTCNNRHLLAWLTRLHGGAPFSLGVARDDPAAIARRLGEACADIVITTGGTGSGEKDYILQVWKELGIEPLFTMLNLSPGASTWMGVRRSEKKQPTLFCALSGNPWSARLVFEEILVPCLWRRQGLGRLSIPVVTAVLKGAIKKRKGTYRAVPGKLHLEAHPPTFTPSDKGKGSLFSTLKNDLAYVLVDAEVERVPWESPVQVRLHDCPLQSLPSYGLLPELKEEDPQC